MAQTQQSPAEPTPDGDRLDSWKEIAVYLDRGVRTVQRWEKEQELPVHRHKNRQHQGPVFAFKGEIDVWWQTHRTELEGENGNGKTPAVRRPSGRVWLVGVAAAVVVLIARNGGTPSYSGPDQPTLQRIFELDWVPGRVSPDGRHVVYMDSKSGHLLIKERGNQQQTREIKVGDRGAGSTAWAPDSRRLAVLTWPPEPDPGPIRQLEIIDIKTSERRVIWKGPRDEAPHPWDWTPDGQTIIAGTETPELTVRLTALSTADGSRIPIAELPKNSGGGTVSPDGRFLAFAACPDNTQCDIYLMPVEGGEPIQLTHHRAQDTSQVWSPDGEHILFVSERLGSEGDLWAVRIDRTSGSAMGRPFLVREFGRRVRGRFTLTRQGELFFWWQSKLPRVSLLDVNPATGVAEGQPESPLPNNTFAPYWIEGGRKIGYRQGSLSGSLRYLDLSTAREEQIGVPGHPKATPLTPSSDGRRLGFYTIAGKERRTIWTYKLGDESARVFQELDGYFHYPMTWSPDGTRLLFTVTKRRPLRQEIRVARSEGGEAVTIAQTTGRPPHATWSPDGTQIAYNDGSCVLAVPATGGETPRRITCTPSADMTDAVRNVGPMGSLSWSPHGDKLAWIINNPDYKRIEMHIVDIGTGVQTLSWAGEPDYESWPRWPAWSPNGDQIAFEMNYKRRFEVWALSGFLPQLELSD